MDLAGVGRMDRIETDTDRARGASGGCGLTDPFVPCPRTLVRRDGETKPAPTLPATNARG
ncbi:hypothetical protein NJ7G_1705 [Natrinema sp. J7-2]|uniref:Uncharacterized protein n=1 Tax=Natrinema gari JCM 14663 TaxID=1230459 RepID=L9Z8Z6_9EURY|nr:hypothetical protein NJ7G_1705 [Natrinema sp. J7-2]ELY82107.1 hypothetical protein C486_05554 [Natrinema gari JCM 14663]